MKCPCCIILLMLKCLSCRYSQQGAIIPAYPASQFVLKFINIILLQPIFFCKPHPLIKTMCFCLQTYVCGSYLSLYQWVFCSLHDSMSIATCKLTPCSIIGYEFWSSLAADSFCHEPHPFVCKIIKVCKYHLVCQKIKSSDILIKV